MGFGVLLRWGGFFERVFEGVRDLVVGGEGSLV